MQAGEVAVGMNVRYPRTGTTGKIVRIEQVERDTFAELDSTHLLYRTDQLIAFEPKAEKEVRKGGEELEQVAKEREEARSIQSQWLSADEQLQWPQWVPVGRMGLPEDQARVILFLASDLSAFVTGHTIPTDGGTGAAGGWFRSSRRPDRKWTNRPVAP